MFWVINKLPLKCLQNCDKEEETRAGGFSD